MRSATIVVVDEDGEAGAGTASVERVVDQDQDAEEEQALAEGYRNNQYYGADGNENAAGDGQSWAGDINNLAEDDNDQDDDHNHHETYLVLRVLVSTLRELLFFLSW